MMLVWVCGLFLCGLVPLASAAQILHPPGTSEDQLPEENQALKDANRQLCAKLKAERDSLAAETKKLTQSESTRVALEQELKDSLEQSERKRKNAEKELTDTNVRLSEVTRQVTALTNDKRRLEGDIATIQSDLNDAISNQRAAQKRAERLADEMKQKNEDSKNAEGLRKLKESRIRDLSSRLDEIEELANQKDIMISKLMANVRDLKAELKKEARPAQLQPKEAEDVASPMMDK